MAPDGSEIRLLATAAQGATRASLCEVRLGAGGVSRPVCHGTVEEITPSLGRAARPRCRVKRSPFHHPTACGFLGRPLL